MNKFRKGQAIVEVLISISFLVVILSAVFNDLLNAEKSSTNALLNTRNAIWSYRFIDERIYKTSDYRLQQRLGLILNPIDQIVNIDLPMDNLWEARGSNFPMAKLNDSWQAKKNSELTKRPAKLVVNNALSGSISNSIQDGLGFLFLSKELRSDSLKFGYINADIVPDEVLIEECQYGC